jgi:hypothetical protein
VDRQPRKKNQILHCFNTLAQNAPKTSSQALKGTSNHAQGHNALENPKLLPLLGQGETHGGNQNQVSLEVLAVV